MRGASRQRKGRVQTALGGLRGDPAQQVRGAANQVAGGAHYAYGRARGRMEDLAEDVIDDGRHLAHTARERAEDLAHTARERADRAIKHGRHVAREARHRSEAYRRQALAYADGHRTNTVLGIAALAFAAGWLIRRKR